MRNAERAEKANDRLQKEPERAERYSYSAFLHAAQAQHDAGNIGDARRLHAQCPESLWALFANGLYGEAVVESERVLELMVEDEKEQYQYNLTHLRTMIAALRAPALGESGVEDD